MKTFHLNANYFFDAENIEDAFQWLADHFAGLAEDGEGQEHGVQAGVLGIHPIARCPEEEHEFARALKAVDEHLGAAREEPGANPWHDIVAAHEAARAALGLEEWVRPSEKEFGNDGG